MSEQIERVAVNDEYKWDLTSIYLNDEAWYDDLEIAKEEIKKISGYKNLLDSASNLLDYIMYDEKVERLLYTLCNQALETVFKLDKIIQRCA